MIRRCALSLAMSLLASPLLAGPQPTPAAGPAQAEVRLDHISVVKLGSGSPVVLIPGLGSPRATWDYVVPALARNHSVYLVQVNGFGNDEPGANLSPESLPEWSQTSTVIWWPKGWGRCGWSAIRWGDSRL